jgi:hypothetical protein
MFKVSSKGTDSKNKAEDSLVGRSGDLLFVGRSVDAALLSSGSELMT